MKISTDTKKKEAVMRMRMIGLDPEVIRQFEKEGLVNESVPPFGACYWLSDEQKARVKAFEAEYSGIVYHVIHGKYVFPDNTVMEMESYLYVDDHYEEWSLDRNDLADKEHLQALCYVYNVTDPELSEFGAVGIKVSLAGGLFRTF